MKRNINLIGLLMLCLLVISTTAFASPKSDLKQIWEDQTFGNARYHVTVDTKMALFGTIKNSSIIDVKREPFFMRSEDSMTMFGKTRTTTSYLLEDGDTLRIYTEEEKYTEDGTKNEWVCYEETLPSGDVEEISSLLLSFDEFVRSVKLLDKDDDKQLYHVTLDGRAFYNSIKKYHEKEDTLPPEGEPTTEPTAETEKQKMMRDLTKELLETWKDTEAVKMMVMVAGGKIVGMQTQLAPQMNAMTHIFATAMDTSQENEEYKMGALAEAFLKTDSMKLTIIEVGEAEFSAVPDNIVKTATAKGSIYEAKKGTTVLQEKKSIEPTPKNE